MTMPLSQDLIHELLDAVMKHGISRDDLLAGIHHGFVSTLKRASDDRSQIFQDLNRLNTVPKLADGSIPLEIWLKNALHHAKAGAQVGWEIYECALEELGALPSDDNHINRRSHNELPPPFPQRLGRWLKKNRKATVPIAGALIVVIAVVIKYTGNTSETKLPAQTSPQSTLPDGPTSSSFAKYCMQPPTFVAGSEEYAFAAGLSESDADKTRGTMQKILEAHPPNGPAWAAAISKSPSISGISTWDVYFKGVDPKGNICKWLTYCKFSAHCDKRLHFSNDTKKVPPETPKEKNP